MKKELIKNKLFGIALIVLGIITTIPDKDGTVLLLAGGLGVALLLAKENYIS